MVNHPEHYTRGPSIELPAGKARSWNANYPDRRLTLECIQVIRHIRDMRLANAMKYIWRVAFGGKANDREDIKKAIWYLQDWLAYPLEGAAADEHH